MRQGEFLIRKEINMYESININYNGVSSASLGLLFIRFENQDNSDTFLSDREVVFDTIQKPNSHKSQTYMYGVKRQPRKFSAEFYCDDITDDKKSQIAKWLDINTFAPFYTDDAPERIYYCVLTGSPKYITNGSQAIVTIEMQCQDEYSYSTLKTNTYDFLLTTGVQTATINNLGDSIISPIIELTLKGNGQTYIFNNNSNSNQTLTLATDSSGNQLVDGEKLVIDCNKEIITTDRIGVFRYDNMQGKFLDFVLGTNTIKVTGNCRIVFKYQYKYLT
jgi:phage-related protein